MGVFASAIHTGFQGVKADTKISHWTIEAGQPKKLSNDGVELNVSNGTVVCDGDTTTPENLLNAAMTIDEFSYALTTYTNIVRQQLFRKLYQIQDRTIDYVDGTAPGTKTEDSFPCLVCGIVLPIWLASIDHGRPREGGASEAVAKVFRGLDMTVGAATGAKAQQLKAGVANAKGNRFGFASGLASLQMIGSPKPVPTKPGRGPKGLPAATTEERYTLNKTGAALYSVAVQFGCVQELQARCMHSIFNLRPLCPRCNSARGNPLKFNSALWW